MNGFVNISDKLSIESLKWIYFALSKGIIVFLISLMSLFLIHSISLQFKHLGVLGFIIACALNVLAKIFPMCLALIIYENGSVSIFQGFSKCVNSFFNYISTSCYIFWCFVLINVPIVLSIFFVNKFLNPEVVTHWVMLKNHFTSFKSVDAKTLLPSIAPIAQNCSKLFGLLILTILIFEIYAMIRLIFAGYIAIDKNICAMDALSKSWKITKNNTLKIFGLYLLFSLLFSFISSYILHTFFSSLLGSGFYDVFINSISTIIWAIFPVFLYRHFLSLIENKKIDLDSGNEFIAL